MLRVEMLPARNGDCLWVEYGDVDQIHRILIDAGTGSSYEALRNRILALPHDQRVFELLVITHIDNDHIEGVIPLLQDTSLGCQFKDIWYNGWKQLSGLDDHEPPVDVLGAREGEFVGVLLTDLRLPWNEAFRGDRIVVPDTGDLPSINVEGLRLTLLSPTRERLVDLRTKWTEVAEDANFTPGDVDAVRQMLSERRYLPIAADQLGVEDGPPGGDNSAANASSIALLAEYDGAAVLLTGDAVPDVLISALTRLGCSSAEPLRVDAFKLPHHGSWQNVTPELLALVRTPRYLISTDGKKHGHPHSEAIDLVLEQHSHRRKPQLIFNYRSPTTEQWVTTSGSGFESVYPEGTTVVLRTRH